MLKGKICDWIRLNLHVYFYIFFPLVWKKTCYGSKSQKLTSAWKNPHVCTSTLQCRCVPAGDVLLCILDGHRVRSFLGRSVGHWVSPVPVVRHLHGLCDAFGTGDSHGQRGHTRLPAVHREGLWDVGPDPWAHARTRHFDLTGVHHVLHWDLKWTSWKEQEEEMLELVTKTIDINRDTLNDGQLED